MAAVRTLVRTTTLLILGVACLATPALAHPGHAGASAGSGLLHPFAGIDHLLAMVAVGLLATRMDDRGRWALPASFLGFLLLGGLAGLAGLGPDAASVEWVIAGSVLVFGLMVSALPRVPLAAAALGVAAFASLHGYAHVAEMGDAMPAAFLGGMLLGTAALHGIGLTAGVALLRGGDARYVRLAGACLALAFLVLLGIG